MKRKPLTHAARLLCALALSMSLCGVQRQQGVSA